MKITFEHIHTHGHVVEDNEQYRHIHYPEMLIRYDSNFIEFKKMPSLIEFKVAELYLKTFHSKYNQKHVKFYFPDNEKLEAELTEYLKQAGYEIGFLELYAIQPTQFPLVADNPDIEVHPVTEENLKTFLELQYKKDLEFGEEFAKQMVDLHKRNFSNEHIMQLMAIYKGIPVGSTDVIISRDTAEIDGLDVDENYQKKGIGSRLQRFVMDTFSDKTIILVADGEDTPREMYSKQNYQNLGFKYQTQTIFVRFTS
jgi:GNAT superfamily N-acetyltransferase